MLPLEIIIFII